MNEALRDVIYAINGVVGNYGWSIVLFTILIRAVCTPFDYKSRVGMRKTQELQPQLAALQKKYAGKDQEKLNRKISELYRENHVSPMSSCLPMLITMPLLFIMFAAMRLLANEHLVQQTFDILQGKEVVLDGWLWVKNVWMPDSPFGVIWPDLNSLRMITDEKIWMAVFEKASDLPAELALTAESFSRANLNGTIESIYAFMSQMPSYVEVAKPLAGFPVLNLWVAQVRLLNNFNGWFLLPILSAATQYLMTIVQPTAAPATGDANAAAQAQSTGKFMKWFFPLFSLWICASYNAVFAIYWVTSNVIAAAQNFAINAYLDKKDAAKKSALISGEGNIK